MIQDTEQATRSPFDYAAMAKAPSRFDNVREIRLTGIGFVESVLKLDRIGRQPNVAGQHDPNDGEEHHDGDQPGECGADPQPRPTTTDLGGVGGGELENGGTGADQVT